MAPFKKTRSLDKNSTLPQRAASSSSATDDFSARRSARVAAGKYAADGDTWIEALAVCEIPVKSGYGDPATAAASKKGGGGGLFRKFKSSKSMSEDDTANNKDKDCKNGSQSDAEVAAASQRLTLRPYFQSQNTGQRVWDEPPSGASNIVYATPEARKMAQAQLEEMRSTYAHAALARRQEREEKKALDAAEGKSSSKQGGGSKMLIPKVFKRSSASNSSAASNSGDNNANQQSSQSSSLLSNNHSNTRIKGSLVLSDEGGRRGIPKSILQESKDLAGGDARRAYEADLQQAMLMSMGIGGGSVMGVGDNHTKHVRSNSKSRSNGDGGSTRNGSSGGSNGLTREEQDQLAMATALSLSEQEARQGSSTIRSRSHQHRKGGSDSSSDGFGGERQHQQQRSRSQSSSKKYASITANMEPSLSDFDDNFDGGGKMPAKKESVTKAKGSSSQQVTKNDDFGDRGSSWELSWSRSGSPKGKDWAMA